MTQAGFLDSKAWGFGLATISSDGSILDVWYSNPQLGTAPSDAVAPETISSMVGEDARRRVSSKVVLTEVDLTAPVADTADAYLRLHLLSTLQVKPNTINLDGLIPALPIVAFTNVGPVALDDLDELRPALTRAGISVYAIDKFPRLVDYVTPRKVRIADASRVRLGAHLSPGTTIMHEGFVNFNAGTLGVSMVEGRISQGVAVGDGADIGGGASIMGTLSGGGKERVAIGARALLGANAGVGISIGDDSVVEAGLYVTAGTKVTIIDAEGERSAKAAELSGVANLLFRRNSVSGRVEVLPRAGVGIVLNSQLHG
ncbi:2,3,4,5-tetrahydropyridine-2,6-dicarboxylate N-succinyltransferase [Rhodoluna sp.]|jgi:2,3,4,5-tetrahydropyridine-2-carboxylate N-succinyltransferase|uniref:2,3,4,5-tetrahydropyridine-2,6-dicarboxylate N-succinyltransferase n=1 Tax=Rhodoluna sp. TaxID=1969481 RepID=UPI0025F5954A|nr:2,3,4,5-tetrahydropyridine-2,6-dicarboxylate N-succinyltransferase [Rhodoluna sp.]